MIAGVDEAGRGALAGPVVAASVILNEPIPGLADSKTLTAIQRQHLFTIIQERGIIRLGLASVTMIDTLNILQATLYAMKRAVLRLPQPVHCIYVDGNHIPIMAPQYPLRAVIKGDSLISVVSAASIVAKVVRDRIMLKWDQRYLGYGFSQHKGYGTRQHYHQLSKKGPTRIHRQSFNLQRQLPLFSS